MHRIIKYTLAGFLLIPTMTNPIRYSPRMEAYNKYVEQMEADKKQEEENKVEDKPEVKPPTQPTPEPPKVEEPKSKIWNVSFYCSCEKCTGKWGGLTASGVQATPWYTIAMDKKYPMGTKLKLEGFDHIFVKEDVGGAIKGNKVDIYVGNDHQLALKLGRQYIKGYILE